MKQPWLYNRFVETIFILFPPFGCLCMLALFPQLTQQYELHTWQWVALILLVDVSHVYTTLFKTYFDPVQWKTRRTLLIQLPFFALIGAIVLYQFSDLWFWRILAYLAVYHFIRQQYGFMRLYSRKEKVGIWQRRIDAFAIYATTLYPMIWWHTHLPREFHWFVAGDFLYIPLSWISDIALGIYLLIQAAYLVNMLILWRRQHFFNLPKNLIWLGTSLSWYVGIVMFNGDLAFTLLNVISHGIPYMALVWMDRRKSKQPIPWLAARTGILLFLALIFALAYLEEGLWDGLIWKEHEDVFGWASYLPTVSSKQLLALIVPILSLPQITHYLLDGFIWRISKGDVNFDNKSASV